MEMFIVSIEKLYPPIYLSIYGCLTSGIQAERELNLPLPFCTVCALSGLDGAHPHWERPSALLSPPVQMLIAS